MMFYIFFKLPRYFVIIAVKPYYMCLILGLQSTSCILLWCLLFPGNYVVVLFSKKIHIEDRIKTFTCGCRILIAPH